MVETISPGQYLILFLGADWWGSDARALAIQIRGLGHSLIEVGYEDYFPIRWSSFPLRLIRRLIRQLCARNFNAAVREQLDNPAIDFVLVFKGMLIEPETIAAFRTRDIPVYCFYQSMIASSQRRSSTNKILYSGRDCETFSLCLMGLIPRCIVLSI